MTFTVGIYKFTKVTLRFKNKTRTTVVHIDKNIIPTYFEYQNDIIISHSVDVAIHYSDQLMLERDGMLNTDKL